MHPMSSRCESKYKSSQTNAKSPDPCTMEKPRSKEKTPQMMSFEMDKITPEYHNQISTLNKSHSSLQNLYNNLQRKYDSLFIEHKEISKNNKLCTKKIKDLQSSNTYLKKVKTDNEKDLLKKKDYINELEKVITCKTGKDSM